MTTLYKGNMKPLNPNEQQEKAEAFHLMGLDMGETNPMKFTANMRIKRANKPSGSYSKPTTEVGKLREEDIQDEIANSKMKKAMKPKFNPQNPYDI
jgi:hypothetical protein